MRNFMIAVSAVFISAVLMNVIAWGKHGDTSSGEMYYVESDVSIDEVDPAIREPGRKYFLKIQMVEYITPAELPGFFCHSLDTVSMELMSRPIN